MKVERSIRRLLRWVLDRMPSEAKPDALEVHENTRSDIVAGAADTYFDGYRIVHLLLPDDLTTRAYPRSYTYRKAAGRLSYRCWHEEVVGTLAHELRHVAQGRMPKASRPTMPEVDAEACARFTIDLYRKGRQCRCATPTPST